MVFKVLSPFSTICDFDPNNLLVMCTYGSGIYLIVKGKHYCRNQPKGAIWVTSHEYGLSHKNGYTTQNTDND